jgi:hypothetical protein
MLKLVGWSHACWTIQGCTYRCALNKWVIASQPFLFNLIFP